MPLVFPGMFRWPEKRYSDLRSHDRPDPERERQKELDWYMQRYDRWRSLYSGSALEETVSTLEDQGTDSDQDTYAWPVRFNLIKSYCLLYAGMLWGRAKTGHESNDLFDIRVDPKSPSGQNATDVAETFQYYLSYFWRRYFHKLRPAAVIQQWAGGCILKVAWNPYSPQSVLGVKLETVQPNHFYPIWNPLDTNELIAVRVKFSINKEVARECYGLTSAEIDEYADGETIRVEEHWDRHRMYIRVGKGQKGDNDQGIPARVRVGPGNEWEEMDGPNPIMYPNGVGVIPFVYVPRLRDGGFFGLSLAHDLEGIQEELNKTLADFGDALTRGTHPSFGISDMYGPNAGEKVLKIPRHGALNMGKTPPNARFQPKIHEFPQPQVPPQVSEFTDRLLNLSEMATGLTPAARGMAGQGSGVARALEMLPTTNLIDWQRSHWTQAIAGMGGINEILGCIWADKGKILAGIPKLQPTAIYLDQKVEYRPVVPRDRLDVIDEVVRLSTAKAISPWEALRRLGDVDDIPDEVMQLAIWLGWLTQLEAAKAGHPLKVVPSKEETPAAALPDVGGITDRPKAKQEPTQPQGMKERGGEDGRG